MKINKILQFLCGLLDGHYDSDYFEAVISETRDVFGRINTRYSGFTKCRRCGLRLSVGNKSGLLWGFADGGEILPLHLGLAWYRFDRNRHVFVLIPFNLFFRAVVAVYYFLRYPFRFIDYCRRGRRS